MTRKESEQPVYTTKPNDAEGLVNEIEGFLKLKGFEEHPESGVFIGKSPEDAEHLLLGFARYFEKEHILVVSEVFEIRGARGIEAVILKIREIAGYKMVERGEGQRVPAVRLDLPHFIIIKKKGNSIEYTLYRNGKDKNVDSLKNAWLFVKNRASSTGAKARELISHLKALGKQRTTAQPKIELKLNMFKTALFKDV